MISQNIFEMDNLSMQLIEFFENQHSCVGKDLPALLGLVEEPPCDAVFVVVFLADCSGIFIGISCKFPSCLRNCSCSGAWQESKTEIVIYMYSNTYIERKRHSHGVRLPASPGARSFSLRRSR